MRSLSDTGQKHAALLRLTCTHSHVLPHCGFVTYKLSAWPRPPDASIKAPSFKKGLVYHPTAEPSLQHPPARRSTSGCSLTKGSTGSSGVQVGAAQERLGGGGAGLLVVPRSQTADIKFIMLETTCHQKFMRRLENIMQPAERFDLRRALEKTDPRWLTRRKSRARARAAAATRVHV